MEESEVAAIKQRAVKTGNGAKGAWQLDLVVLQNGTEARIFAPIEVGDPVESYERDGYTNWRIKDGATSSGSAPKPAGSTDGTITTDQIYAEVLKQGKQLVEINDRLKALMGEPVETPEVQAEQEDKRANKAAKKEPDVVIEDIGDEPINLDDIPF